MAKQLEELREDFVEKVERLERAGEILKTEFVGIDKTIDEIIDNVRSWYTMSSIQDRPCVVNLWGLTGVGKTSLIQRLMELLEFSDHTYRLDLGVKEGNLSFRHSLSDLCENKGDEPIVILLDEFQHARTIIGTGLGSSEIDDDKNRMVWELIDSGKVTYVEWMRGLYSFEDGLSKMKRMLGRGVRVEKGIVVEGVKLFMKEMDIKNLEEGDSVYFFPQSDYENIIEFAGDKLELHLRDDVEKRLLSMDGKETTDFLSQVLRLAQRPKVKSFTKALIVILGNMDEAYTMSSDYSSDVSADEFYEQSLKITIPDMKAALRSRFRNEQVARLGNNHIIYPALSESAYRKIIDLQLERLNQKMQDRFAISMSFEEDLKDVIYKEGVYPTQGARPLLTTIRNLINSRISIYLNRILKNNLEVDHLNLFIEDEKQLVCEFYHKEQLCFTYSDTLQLSLHDLRKTKDDEMQSIVAVHESGHAVLSSYLMGTIPQLVVSASSDSSNHGFVYAKRKAKYFSRAMIVRRIAVQLGGIVAEEIIFGKENVTTGAESDLLSATNLAMAMCKESGLGKSLIAHASNSNEVSSRFHDIEAAELEAKELIEQGRILALQTLRQEKRLLAAMADLLTTDSRIDHDQIKDLIHHFGSQELKTLKTHFYRDRLKDTAKTLNVLNEITESNPIILNKDNNEKRA